MTPSAMTAMAGAVARRPRRESRRILWHAALLLPSGLFILLPLLVLLRQSLVDGETARFTLDFYARIFAGRYWDRVQNTLIVAFLVTGVSLGMGVPLTLYIWRREFPGKRLLTGLLIVPYMTPNYILVLSIIFLFGKNGAATILLRFLLRDPAFELPLPLLFTYQGMILVFTFHSLALVVFILLALLSSLPRDYEEAAVSLGATPLRAVTRVILPLAAPAIAGSGALVFASVMVNYVIVFLMGGTRYTTLAVEVVNRYFGYLYYELAAALAVFLSLLTMGIMYAYLFLLRRRFEI